MAEQRPFDLAEFFREFTTQWERDFDSLANRVMGTEDFSRSMNQLQRTQMAFQRSFHEFMGQQLTKFNVASRDDVVRLGETVHAMDARLGRLEMLLERMANKAGSVAPNAPVPGPPRTKRPPSMAGTPKPEDKP